MYLPTIYYKLCFNKKIVFMFIAECAWNLGQVERGVEWARAAVQAGGGERAGAGLARLLLAAGDVRGASAAYDHAIA